jgi:hypothetical protein
MEYKDFFSPKTLEKLNKKSAENLKTMLGDKNLMQTIMSSQQLLPQISKAEAPYKSQLEKLAVDMVKELYPIIDEEGIILDAKIDSISNVGSELDEIKVNNPILTNKLIKQLADEVIEWMNSEYESTEIIEDDIYDVLKHIIFNYQDSYLQKISFELIYDKVLNQIKQDPQGYIFTDVNEIKINRPGIRLKIRQFTNDSGWILDKDNPWGNWEELFGQEKAAYVSLYKNYAYVTLHNTDNLIESLEKLKDILTKRGIPSQMVTWYSQPYIKILSKYYDLLELYSPNLDEIKINKPGARLKIQKLNPSYGYFVAKDNPWIGKEFQYKSLRMQGVVCDVSIYKNYIYLHPHDQINNVKNILDHNRIPHQITTFYGFPVIKILSKNYDLLEPTPPNINEIKVNNPSRFETLKRNLIKLIEDDIKNINYEEHEEEIEEANETIEGIKLAKNEKDLRNALIFYTLGEEENIQYYLDLASYKEKYNNPLLKESITPESRRRIINAITQGAALRGTFAFYLFKEHLNDLDPTLVEKYNQIMKNSFGIYDDENAIAMMLAALAQGQKTAGGSSKVIINEIKINQPKKIINLKPEPYYDIKGGKYVVEFEDNSEYHIRHIDSSDTHSYDKSYIDKLITHINEIKVVNPTQFVNYREASLNYLKHLKNQHFQDSNFLEPNHPLIKSVKSSQSEDELDKIMIKNLFMDDDGEYDKEDYQKTKDLIKRKYSKINEINESSSSGITIQARAANFPMLVHEIIKGLYELISLQGFKGSKEERQAVVDKVDLLKNEPSDLRYGKFIYDALNKIFINSEYNDPRVREFFFADVYQLDDDEFISFIENAINEELTPAQQKWANDTLREISSDLKADDYDTTGLDEIKIEKPFTYEKAYGESHSYDEFIKNIKSTDQVPDNYLVDLTKDKIIASFTGWNVAKWAKKAETSTRGEVIKKDYRVLSRSALTNPPPYLNTPDIDIYDPNSWEPGNVAISLIREYNTIKEIKVNNPSSPEQKIYMYVKSIYPEATLNKNKQSYHNFIISFFPETQAINRNSIISYKPEEYTVFLGNDTNGRRFKNPDNLIKYIKNNPVEPNIDEIKINKPPSGMLRVKRHEDEDRKDVYYPIGLNNKPIEKTKITKTDPYSNTYLNGWFSGDIFLVKDGKNLRNFLNQRNIPYKYWNNSTLSIPLNNVKIIDEIKTNEPLTESFLTSFNKDIKTFINNNLNKYSEIISKSLLNEYSDKTIATTIERWKTADPKTDENLAKQLIQRFDQIKSGLAQKLNIVVLPDELKKGNNYLNIDKYSYGDMINLIKSLPENPEKVKKDAISNFVQRDGIDKPTAQSYVTRFIVNKDKLKIATQEGLEDEGFTKEEVLNFIPKRLLSNNAYLDPRAWTWQPFEQMIDALFPSQKAAGEGGENFVSTDADKIYDKGGIEIYKGDDLHKCISYNPVSAETKRKKYGWCVTQVGNTNYDYYRFGDKGPTFYFVFDRSKDSSPEHSPFKDQWHAFVIQVTADDKEYIVTGADNRGDVATKDKGWEGIANIVPADTWAKIKGLKNYFKPISLSAPERGRKFASGKDLSLDEFKELSQDEKILYVQGKASKNAITPEILKILPQYKINLEGRSTTLANIAMDSRQKFPYSALKDNEALAKRYAVVSSRHFPNDPLPLPFIKYLDEGAKQKYLEKYDDNLTFEYIEKYFGEQVAEKYVEQQLKNLNYLPKSAAKYIKNDKLKQLFEIYSKLFDSWEFGKATNISDEQLENSANMPEQTVTPVPLDQKQWSNLSSTDRKTIIDLIGKFNKNTQYLTLLYALPFMVTDGSKKYVLLPKDTSNYQYDSWALMDEQGKIVKDNISGNLELDNQPLYLGYPDDSTDFNRIYSTKDLK